MEEKINETNATPKEEVKQTIKSASETYEPKFKKITDFDKVSVDLDLFEKEQEFDGKKKILKYTTIEDMEVRVPDQVLKQLKKQLEANKDLKFFKVVSEGQGLATEYTVIPLAE